MTFHNKKIDSGDMHVLKSDSGKSGKTVFLEIDDEVTTAYDRIKQIREKKITIVIPKHAAILRSIVNLKILKRKMDDIGKNVVIVTNDIAGRKLAQKSGFEVIARAAMKEETGPISRMPSKETGKTERPIKTSSGEKTSISTLLEKGRKAAFPLLAKIKAYLQKRKKKKKYATEIVIVTPNKGALITLITISVFLLAAIAYIALPGATIAVTPSSQRIEQSLNITLLDFEKYQGILETRPENVIPSFPMRPPPVIKTFSYPATGKLSQGKDASGIITITNAAPHDWPLVANTRFQTEDGIVFRIRQAVTVPRKRGNSPGALDVTAYADPFDANGQIVGERGNIEPARFFLPGLKNPENQKKLYGVSSARMTGGVTKVIKTVSEDDIASAEARAKKEMKILARRELESSLRGQNIERGIDLVLIDHPRTISISEPKITIPENQIGQEKETFDAIGEVTVSGFAFRERELMNFLRTAMNLRKSPDRTIVQINDESMTYKLFEIEEGGSRVKLTATLRGIEQYDLDLSSEYGLRFIKKITDHVVGKTIDDAAFYIQNLPEIERVEIKSWPFWAPTLPTVPDNIKFEIRSGFEEFSVTPIPAD